jgi:hypothetical protein
VKVCGIDYSVHAVDLVLLDETTDEATHTRISLAGAGFHSARSLRRVFPGRSWWEERGVYLVGMEDPFSNRAHTTKVQGYIAGAIGALLPPELDIVLVPPQEWCRILTGSARAEKELIRGAAANRLAQTLHTSFQSRPWSEWPQDAFDAYGVAYATRHLNRQAIERRGAAA